MGATDESDLVRTTTRSASPRKGWHSRPVQSTKPMNSTRNFAVVSTASSLMFRPAGIRIVSASAAVIRNSLRSSLVGRSLGSTRKAAFATFGAGVAAESAGDRCCRALFAASDSAAAGGRSAAASVPDFLPEIFHNHPKRIIIATRATPPTTCNLLGPLDGPPPGATICVILIASEMR